MKEKRERQREKSKLKSQERKGAGSGKKENKTAMDKVRRMKILIKETNEKVRKTEYKKERKRH